MRCLIEGKIHVRNKKNKKRKHNYNGEDNEYNTSRFVSI